MTDAYLPRARTWLAATLALLLAACGGPRHEPLVRPGESEADALARMETDLQSQGATASSRLRVNYAWLALRVNDKERATQALAQIPDDAPRDVGAQASFLRGNLAFARAAAARTEAIKPGADPRARTIALRFGEDALAAWQLAAASRADWPEAQRNVERALRWIRDLRERSARRESRPRPTPTRPNPEDRPQGDPKKDGAKPPPPTQRRPEDLANERPTRSTPKPLSPAEVLELLTRLRSIEAEKQTVRRERRRAQSAEVEKDW